MPPKRGAGGRGRAAKKSRPSGDADATADAALKGFVCTLPPSASSTLEASITDAGGKVITRITKTVTHVLATQEEVDEGARRVAQAEDKGLPVVAASFVKAALSLGDWTKVDVAAHTLKDEDGEETADEESNDDEPPPPPPPKAKPSKKKPKAARGAAALKAGIAKAAAAKKKNEVKTLAKSGVPLDPYLPAQYQDKYHVYISGTGDIYDVMLNQTNLKGNNNKFYVIQLLELDAGQSGAPYLVWNRWGRVGYKGMDSDFPCDTLGSAQAQFNAKFQSKTKNNFAARANFVPYSGKYTLIEREYSTEDAGGKEEEAVPESTLDEAVQRVVSLMCNKTLMKKQMARMGYDADKMPLGKVSKDMVKQGYEVLNEISEVISKKKAGDLAELSSRFYTVIPHNFGFQKMSNFIINNNKTLKDKIALVEALGDIEVASEVLQAGESPTMNPLDMQYQALKCLINPAGVRSADVALVKAMLQTKGPTHRDYVLELTDLYSLERKGEQSTFDEVAGALDNHQLLWHGSRMTNFAGIISQGLRIAPPEAPVTGYMFGKGVYFANCVTKSSNYCFTDSTSNTGLMLLCEVALGTPNVLTYSDYYADRLPAGTHSTWGRGRNAPDPAGDVDIGGGVKAATGKCVPVVPPVTGALLYDEFIVYNTMQIKMKYLVKLKFNYGADSDDDEY